MMELEMSIYFLAGDEVVGVGGKIHNRHFSI
jgi:hypothetical protein